MSYYGRFPRYVSVAEKKAKAAKKLKQLRKKNPDINPIVIEGKAIAGTWWGKSWNINLERYADYSNRIERGRSYVRHGAVLDLQINPGEVKSLVQGTAPTPYAVAIKIKAISRTTWKNIKNACEGKLDSLQELLTGKFPKSLAEIFTAQGKGLFPSPQEIDFSCSCPDWAYMCKHVAATLYGIGARLDEDPSLFFTLRKVEINELISQAVEDKTLELLKKAKKKSARVIADSDLADVFGIDLEENFDFNASAEPKASAKKPAPPKPVKARPAKSSAKKPAKVKPLKKAATQTPSEKSQTDMPAIEVVARIIGKSRKGIGMAALKQRTGFNDRQLYNILYKLKSQDRIKRVSRGVYSSA
jgi:uncharacterized Zn finger protein